MSGRCVGHDAMESFWLTDSQVTSCQPGPDFVFKQGKDYSSTPQRFNQNIWGTFGTGCEAQLSTDAALHLMVPEVLGLHTCPNKLMCRTAQ